MLREIDEESRLRILPRTPMTARYRGPVRYVIPGTAAHVDMFCPKCGGTDLERIDFRAFQHERTETFRCRSCGRVFRLALYANDDGKRFTVRYDGNEYGENLTMMEMNGSALYALSDVVREGDKRHWRLASSYFGNKYDDLVSDHWDDDPEGWEKTLQGMECAIPGAEYGYALYSGYFGGMDVGEEVRLPDVPLSIVRTKNSKHRKGRKWFRCST